jgi:hypothetical protein
MSRNFDHSDDSYSAPDPLPSPGEFSHLITEPDLQDTIYRRFIRKPTSSAILRYYVFLSHNIAQIEEDLERHYQERTVLWEHLFDSQSFRTRIRPIVRRYRHMRALKRRGYHPYGRMTSPKSSSDNNSPSMEDIHLGPVPGRPSTPYLQLSTFNAEEQIEEHIKLEDCDATLNTEPMEEPTDEKYDKEKGCAGCQGGHEFLDCPREYIFNEEIQDYTPIPDGENPLVPRYIPDPTNTDKGKQVPCQRCFQVGHRQDDPCQRCNQTGHCREDCETPMKSVDHCTTCDWKGNPQENCQHVDVSPGWIKRTKARLEQERA